MAVRARHEPPDGGARHVKVAEILARKNAAVITIKPTDTIEALSRLLRHHRVGAATVSSDGRRVEGVITERDVVYAVATHGADLAKTPVSALMTRQVITCAPGDAAGQVASIMQSHRFRHIPVVENDLLIGMVSIRDVLNLRVDELQQQAAMLRNYAMNAAPVPQDR